MLFEAAECFIVYCINIIIEKGYNLHICNKEVCNNSIKDKRILIVIT